MTSPVLVQVGVAWLPLVSWWHGALGGSRRPWARGRAFAERTGLPGEAVDARLVRRVVRRQRFVQAGIVLGAAVAYQVQGSWTVGGSVWIGLYGGLAVGTVADQLTARFGDHGVPAGLRPVFENVPLAVLVALPVVGPAHEVLGGPRHWRRRLVAVG